MAESWWIWATHGCVNATMILLAWCDWRRVHLWRCLDDDATVQLDHSGPVTPRDYVSPCVELLARLREELPQLGSAPACTALLNEATSELEGGLGRNRIASQGWRVCVASGIALACLIASTEPAIAMVGAMSGVVGATITWYLGRMADSLAGRLRSRWNGLIRRLARSFPQSETFGEHP